MNKNTRVYVIIVNYLNWQDTYECIRSLLASSYHNYLITVVDNGSNNNSVGQLKKALSGITNVECFHGAAFDIERQEEGNKKIILVQNNVNGGFAAANNLVLRKLLGEDAYVWLLNPDVTVEPETMEKLVDFADQQGGNKIIGSVIKSYRQKNKVLIYGGGQIHFNSGTIRTVTKAEDEDKLDYVSGASLFAHSSIFQRTGLLPEDYFLIWEETDWCYSARQKGFGLAVCPGAICYDKISTVIGTGFMAHYYYTRNGLYFIKKYHPAKLAMVRFYVFLRVIRRILTGQWVQARGVWKGMKDFRKNKKNALE